MIAIGVAGLPGSGKSNLMDTLEAQGYARYNDVNRDWTGNLPKARADAQNGRDTAISDIMFCEASWREKLERELGLSVQWIFFENNPWQCAKNCVYRFMFEKPHRPLQEEIRMICKLSPAYAPHGDIRPVVRADSTIPSSCLAQER